VEFSLPTATVLILVLLHAGPAAGGAKPQACDRAGRNVNLGTELPVASSKRSDRQEQMNGHEQWQPPNEASFATAD
jgi:hypothetical protein